MFGKRSMNLVLTLAMLLTLGVGAVSAAPPAQEEMTYTVEKGDNLWTVAEKHLGNGRAYWVIVSATNAKHDEDPSFAYIENPGQIYPGWKLLIPSAEATALALEIGEALQALLDQQVKEQDILGMAMAVRLADGTVIGRASGYSDPSGEEAWSVDTVSALASVTKPFAAVVVMQLVEDGKLSLDDTIDTWFPEQPNGDRITIRMLLSHTSGLAPYITSAQGHIETREGKFSNYWAPMDIVAKANEIGPVGEPGSSEGYYADTNFVLLGLIVEEVTGNSWAQEVESRIIEPLDLKDTTFLGKEGTFDIMVGGYTKMDFEGQNLLEDGYQNLLEEPWCPHPSTVYASGDIVSTVSDLMTFASALFDGKLVSRETLAVMAQPLATDVPSGMPWGLGGGVLQIDGLRGYGMGGNIPGFNSFFIGALDTRLVVTALCNTQEGDVMMPSFSAFQYISQ